MHKTGIRHNESRTLVKSSGCLKLSKIINDPKTYKASLSPLLNDLDHGRLGVGKLLLGGILQMNAPPAKQS